MKQIKILNLCAKHPADDGRVYHKLSKTMVSRGYEVHNTSPNVSTYITNDNIYIHGFIQKSGILNRISSLKKLYKLCINISPDVIFSHEPDALVVGYLYYLNQHSKKNHIKLFFDCHEVYEYWFDGKTKSRLLNSLLNFLTINTIYYIVKRITGVTSVNSTMTERFKKINSNSYMIPSITSIDDTISSINNPRINNSSVFFGQFFLHEHKIMLLQAAEILKKQNISHCISIIGGERGKNASDNTLVSLVNEKGLSNYFKFYGWLDRTEAFEKIRQYPIGMMRFDSFYTKDNYGLPNKIFEYMSNGIAILGCSLNKEIANIINEEKCGILIPEETGEALAKALIFTNEHPSEVIEMGKNAYKATQEKYNWKVFGDILDKIINQ